MRVDPQEPIAAVARVKAGVELGEPPVPDRLEEDGRLGRKAVVAVEHDAVPRTLPGAQGVLHQDAPGRPRAQGPRGVAEAGDAAQVLVAARNGGLRGQRTIIGGEAQLAEERSQLRRALGRQVLALVGKPGKAVGDRVGREKAHGVGEVVGHRRRGADRAVEPPDLGAADPGPVACGIEALALGKAVEQAEVHIGDRVPL